MSVSTISFAYYCIGIYLLVLSVDAFLLSFSTEYGIIDFFLHSSSFSRFEDVTCSGP